MNLLKEPNRQAIYWCVRDINDINKNIKSVLTNDSDRVVKIDGFDEFMVALQSKVYEFESIKSLTNEDENESLIVKNALKKVKIYKKELMENFSQEVQSSKSEEFKENSKSILPTWWDYQLKANEEKDINKKDEIFKVGIKEHPRSFELMCNYANFLYKVKEDFKNTEIYYSKALDIEPNNANINYNYANFLYEIKNNYDIAEKCYLKTLLLQPNKANVNGIYAVFLNYIRKDFNNAEKYYLKALEIEPNNPHNNGNYSSFLLSNNRKEESIKYLNNAYEFYQDQKDLLIELWFYKLAHFKEDYQYAKENLDKLLKDGYKSTDWDFSLNIKQAIKDGHKNIDELKEYAHKISGLDYSKI